MKRLAIFLVLSVLLSACTVPGVGGRVDAPTPKPLGTRVAVGQATPTTIRRADTTAVPNTSASAGAALVEQAISLLLDRYVEPLRSNDLYQIAYDATAVTLRNSGVTPTVPTVAFTGDRKKDASAFKEAYLALAENAGAAINQSALAYAAIDALTDAIGECHTYFLNPEETKRAKAQDSGQESFTGIGVVINSAVRPATIIKVYKGSPAEQAGLREGDSFVMVDGINVTDLPSDQISPLVRGPEGTQVRVVMRRAGAAGTLEFTITRAKINVPVFEQSIRRGPNGEKIGYMELSSFSAQLTRTGVGDGVEKDIQAALEEFEREGVVGWVLDLRNNPGGYIVTLMRVASRFIKDGQPVAYYIREQGKEEAIKTDRRSYFSAQRPFAVLINGGSGSSSEAFAAAAQDYGFARVFGQTTSGCLAAGQRLDLADGSALNVTVEKVVSPKRREINRVGVKPDAEVIRNPGDLNDPVATAAITWLIAQPQPSR